MPRGKGAGAGRPKLYRETPQERARDDRSFELRDLFDRRAAIEACQGHLADLLRVYSREVTK